ncbi:SNF2 N-terminal domain-containing protein [Caenorhabditis elegans]|uniref:SNF2 N-terminal domain-containing protein n=1 Tax=Caenorhabditis elegans TaxID=6239 RepID=G5EDD0_CAEEL|nr:SNF2 N-terminal domain-containing protein [Caenorhabditis elegans]CAB07268.2 SNF2 N-terminal domain-containing protein [Caenorhabditis elegans]|eukprot:NP_507782.2 Uncharacterized protein CELE_M04C3.1 [Caenorhabditis elegans]
MSNRFKFFAAIREYDVEGEVLLKIIGTGSNNNLAYRIMESRLNEVGIRLGSFLSAVAQMGEPIRDFVAEERNLKVTIDGSVAKVEDIEGNLEKNEEGVLVFRTEDFGLVRALDQKLSPGQYQITVRATKFLERKIFTTMNYCAEAQKIAPLVTATESGSIFKRVASIFQKSPQENIPGSTCNQANENQQRRMSFKLDKKQEELMVRIAELENGENHGGIITTTTATNDLRIRQVLIEHILQQRSLHKREESQANRTLIIGSPSWIKKFEGPLENITKSSQNNDFSFIFFNGIRRPPTLTSIRKKRKRAGKDIVLINYYWLETIQNLPVTWERIIFHDFTLKFVKSNTVPPFRALCKLKATFRWCITENHKQDRLVKFFNPSLGYISYFDAEEKMKSTKKIEEFLKRVNLYLPSAEPTDRIGFVLDLKQKEMMASMEKREDGDDQGGIVTVATNDRQIDQVIIAYILKQREQGTSRKKVNLIVGTPMWMKSWKLQFDEFIKAGLLNDNDLTISYFYNRTKSRNSNELARNDIVITTYDTLKKEANLPIFKAVKWERIILYEANKISDMNTVRFQAICQLQAKYRWCLTESPKQQSLSCFLKQESFGNGYSLKNTESVKKQNNFKEDTVKQQANLIFSSTELKLKTMKIVLNTRQKEFMNSMAQCETGPTNERIAAYGMEENEIGEAIIAFLLEQKYNSERNDILMGETLVVVSDAKMDSWLKHVKKLAKEDDLNIHNIHEEDHICEKDYIRENKTSMFIEWERIIFYGFSLHCAYKYQENRFQLYPDNCWYITEDITHLCSVHFLEAKERSFFRTEENHFTFLTSAIQASKADEYRQFSNNMWQSIDSYTYEFFDKNFEIWPVKNDESLEEMYEMMCLGLSGSAAALIIRLWVDVHWNHIACDYDSFFISRDEMDDIVARWKKSIDLIEDAQIDLIRDVLVEKKLLSEHMIISSICKTIFLPNLQNEHKPTYFSTDMHTYIIYNFSMFLIKAKEMSEQNPPDIVMFCNLIWGAAVICLRKFFLSRFQLEVSKPQIQEKLMKIVLESFTNEPIVCGRLYEAWEHAKRCCKSAYTLGYICQQLRNKILQLVGDMEECINKADIERIRKQLEVSDLQILELSKMYSMNIGEERFFYNRIAC